MIGLALSIAAFLFLCYIGYWAMLFALVIFGAIFDWLNRW